MTLSLASIIGFLTISFAILVKIIGLPDQARKNYLRKSTEGISTPFFILVLISYSFWVLHGVMEKDMVLIVGQGVGVITSGIIVFQIIKYRKNK